jgi:hypothetical protein
VADFLPSGAPTGEAHGVGHAVARRTLFTAGAGIAAWVATGCSVDDPVTGDDTPRSPAELAPDVTVATRALAEITAARMAVTSTLTRFPAVRPALATLVPLHQAHEKSLVDAVPARARTSAPAAPFVVARGRDAALRNLARREQRLHDTLDALALRAQSGDFARLLASMGAGVQQQLAGWPS